MYFLVRTATKNIEMVRPITNGLYSTESKAFGLFFWCNTLCQYYATYMQTQSCVQVNSEGWDGRRLALQNLLNCKFQQLQRWKLLWY